MSSAGVAVATRAVGSCCLSVRAVCRLTLSARAGDVVVEPAAFAAQKRAQQVIDSLEGATPSPSPKSPKNRIKKRGPGTGQRAVSGAFESARSACTRRSQAGRRSPEVCGVSSSGGRCPRSRATGGGRAAFRASGANTASDETSQPGRGAGDRAWYRTRPRMMSQRGCDAADQVKAAQPPSRARARARRGP